MILITPPEPKENSKEKAYDSSIKRIPHRMIAVEDRGPSLSPLPQGFPGPICSPMAWRSSDLREMPQYVYELTATDVKERDEALQVFKS
jgi:hypothetical protein